MRYLLAATFCMCVLLAAAQKTTKPSPYKASIGISPLALLDVDNGLMLSGEYRFNNRLAAVLDASYLFHSYYLNEPEGVSGFTVRPSVRLYPGKQKGREFLQLQGFYKHVDYTFFGWVDKNVVNGVPSYSQLQDYKYRKEVWGVNFMAGFVEPISAGRFHLDMTTGVGIRFKRQGVTDPNTSIRQRRNVGIYREKMTTFSLPVNLKLTYALGNL